MADGFLRGAVALGLLVAASTEALGAAGLLSRWPVAVFWCCVLLAVCRSLKLPARKAAPVWVWLSIAAFGAISIILLLLALKSPPNSSDAMSYHLPRVIYWVQQKNVAFFPTPYLPQIMMPPLAEYFMLHTYLLAGGDRFANLVQWFGFVGSAIGVAGLAAALGASLRGQMAALLIAATLPNAILQASGAKNELLLALYLVAALRFALAWRESGAAKDAAWAGLACGLAVLTKGTAYLFAPFLLAAAVIPRPRVDWKRAIRGAAVFPALAAAPNLPHYARCFALSGTPLGYDSAHADEAFRWRNERLGWRATVSNLLRHASEQLGDRHESWNQAVYRTVISLHGALGIDPNDPATTWRWTRFEAPRNANHETNANNRWHLLLLWLTAPGTFWIKPRERRITLLVYAGGILAALAAFCFYLKWQPFMARMLLPLFIAAAPLAAIALDAARMWIPSVACCLFLLNNARPYLAENWVRPWKGPASVWRSERNAGYFADLTSWNNKNNYLRSVEIVLQSGCRNVATDLNDYHIEYPLQALLISRQPATRFAHTNVRNNSERYRKADAPAPCAVVCFECAGKPATLRAYREYPLSEPAGDWIVFLRQ